MKSAHLIVGSVLAFFAIPVLLAQQPAGPTSQAARFTVSEYGNWQAHSMNSVAAGSRQIYVDQCFPNLGTKVRQFFPFAMNAPVVIVDGANTETVTPFQVNSPTPTKLGDLSTGSYTCSFVATYAHAHPSNVTITSATAGLEEAINDAHNRGGGVVVIDSPWSGQTSMITSTGFGFINVLVEDLRAAAGSVDQYQWNGANYILQLAGGVAITRDVTSNGTPATATGMRGNVGVGAASASGQGYVWNTANSDFELQTKLTVDVRDPIPSYSAGAKCNGTTDDTAAIQGIYNYYGRGGPGQGQQIELQFPSGTCKISSQLVFEGDNGVGIHIAGTKGWGNLAGTTLAWYGPNFGTMQLMLGCNGCTISDLDLALNESGNGGGKAQNGLWWDASNTIGSSVAYNISTITRAGNVVTATTSAPHAITPIRIVKVAGVSDSSFNGTFRVLYANSNTTGSWIQKGSDTTSRGGTVTNYKSATSNNLRMSRVQITGQASVSTTVSAIRGTDPNTTITSSTAQFINLGDTVIVRGVTDASYNCAYIVSAVNSSTNVTAGVLPGTGCSPSGTVASGGTILSGSSGVRVGHRDAATEQVSAVTIEDLFVQGDQLGGSVNCLEGDGAGNVKDFLMNNLQFNGCRYGVNGFGSGNLDVYGYTGGLVTPDSDARLATVDFVNTGGQTHITGAETENFSNARFWVSTAGIGSSETFLDNISFQSSGPTDDLIVIWGGAMTITASHFLNERASNTTPYLSCGSPLFATNGGCSLMSFGNFYANTNIGGSALAPGFVPVKDRSGNTFQQSGGFYANKALNITSFGDTGSTTNSANGTMGQLRNVLSLYFLASAVCGGTNGVADTGWLRLCDTDSILFRNHTNGGNVNGLSKNTRDVVSVGDKAGASFSGPIFLTPNLSWSLGAGVPSAGSCVAANGGSLYSRTDGDATHTLYVCDNSTHTWTPK